MAKIKNVFGEDRIVPWLGDRLVYDGQEVEVPAEDVYSYTQQTGWEPVDDEAKAIHDEASAIAEEVERVETGGAPQEPSGNATTEEWAAYVISAGLATEEQIAGLGRNEIRDTYKHTEA